MDDKKETISDDEFHFTEAEEVKSDHYDVPAENISHEGSTRFNRRNILITIGIIIVALSLYKLINVFLDSGSKKPPETTVPTPAPTPAPPPTIPEVSQTATTLSDLKDQLYEMQQMNAAATQQMSSVSDRVNTLNNSMTTLTNQVNNINQQLQTLTSQVQSQQNTINTIQFKPKASRSKIIYHKYYPLPPRPRWYIQAMVPGRAWLIQMNGHTTTVRKGDWLSGYGRITYISVVTGLVKTSTGAIITFRDL